MNNTHLLQLFSQAYMIGGSPCSGKSTVAEMLAAQYGFHYYKADDYDPEHMQRARPDQQPVMFKISKMSWDEIWSRPPEKQYADELEYYRERFPFILDDLAPVDTGKPVLLEGAAFLPELVCRWPVPHENVVFMIPTSAFQRHHYSQRPWIPSILEKCQDPTQAFDNWMKRDEFFAQEIARQAQVAGYTVITVDGSVDIQKQYEWLTSRFKLS